MARVVLGMQEGVGRRNTRMTEVVRNDLEVHLIALVGSSRVAHPGYRCLLDVCGRRFRLGITEQAQSLSQDSERPAL